MPSQRIKYTIAEKGQVYIFPNDEKIKHLPFLAGFKKVSEVGRKMLCHFRFHSTSLSYKAAGLDFKALSFQGENKNKYLFCGLLCFNMAVRRDAN